MAEKLLSAEALKYLLNDAPENLKSLLFEALFAYHQAGGDKRKADLASEKLRRAYYSLSQFLLETSAQNLNEYQKLFVNTGALAETVEISTDQGKRTIELLPSGTLARLLKDYVSEAPAFLLTTYDRWKALATGELSPLSPSGQPEKRRKSDPAKDAQKQAAQLQTFYQQTAENLQNLEPKFKRICDLLTNPALDALGKELMFVKHYLDLIKTKPQEALKLLHRRPPQVFSHFAFTQELQQAIQDFSAALHVLENSLERLLKAHTGWRASPQDHQEKAAVVFHREALKSIKRDTEALTPFLVRGAQASPQKIPFADARILVKEAIDPDKEHLLTPESVKKSMDKLTSLHVNLFPRDATGKPMLPPVCVEPTYDYAEWFGDRLVLSIVAPLTYRRGPKVSFTPVDMLLLKGFGQILAKDPIFDYRGEPNLGTFMGDYAGRIEKKAKVQWTGPQKKATMVMSSKIVDQASREEAVRDYMDFVYAMVNGFPPPPRISRRKIATLFKYVILKDEEFSARLMLIHVGTHDPGLAREILLQYTNKVTREAIALARKAFETSDLLQKHFQKKEDLFLGKIFGKTALE